MHRSSTTRALVAAIAAALSACSSGSSAHDVEVTALTVSPAASALPLGTSRAFTARARLSDGSEQDVTTSVTWSTSDPAVLRIGAASAAGVQVTGAALGTAQLAATLDGVRGGATVDVTAAALQSLSVSPALTAVAAGFSRQLTATATFTDGSKADVTAAAAWTTSGSETASVAAGLVTGLAQGAATVTASYGELGASSAVTVSAATLQSIAVTPGDSVLPLGVGVTLSATGLFSDGKVQDLTGSVSWTSLDPAVATVSAAGAVQPVATGTTTMIAALAGRTGTARIQVTAATLEEIDVYPGALTLARGTTAAFTAVGTFSDGSSADVTASATWSADSEAVLLSSPAAEGVLAKAATPGSATITASLGAVSGAAAIEVTAAQLASLAIAPAPLSIPTGLSEQLTAIGAFTDGTTQDLTGQVAWLSSDDGVAAISNASGSEGLLTAISPGPAAVTATLFGVSSSADVSVTAAALQTVTVSPAIARVPAGYQISFAATGTYTDGSAHDVTASAAWSSSDTAVATVVATGVSAGTATGLAPGVATIAATLDGLSGSAALTVASARLTSVAVEPPSFTVAVGAVQALRAVGTFSDATTSDITRQCVWSSSSRTIAVVSRGGVVTGVRAGGVTITAKRSGRQGRAEGSVQ